MNRVSRASVLLSATILTGALAASAVPAASASPSGVTSASTASAGSPTTSASPTVPRRPRPVTFTIGTFNVLGASHTPAGGRRATGNVRIVRANRLLDKHHVDVAGFQELQSTQLTKLMSITHGDWSFYPGLSMRKLDSENSIGWRSARFELVQATTVNIPYFNGHPRAMPVVLLRERSTGMMAYFANFHNPAETKQFHRQGHWRSVATGIEIALQKKLFDRGLPRFVTGDMNERAPYFCRVGKQAPLIAARPSTYVKNGKCHANKVRTIDWILGARKVGFSHYSEDRSHLDSIASDHPVVTSEVTVDPARLPRAWGLVPPAPGLATLVR